MTEKKYIGYTIGPICDTLNLTSSPVALWAASYLFSTLSKTICRLLCENGVAESQILTPYYAKDDEIIHQNNGIGMFPDHIIFDAESFDVGLTETIKQKAIAEIAKLYGISEEYLREYLMISAIEFYAKNPIQDSAKQFDCAELACPFVFRDDSTPLQTLFAGDRYSHNSRLSQTDLVKSMERLQLKNPDGSFRSIEELVSTGEGYKKFKYYALVHSDGDNMSQIIASLEDQTQVRDFSKTCLKYCADIAKKVKEYDGFTVYSGGDDLLAILPCESSEGKTPFDFAQEASRIFDVHFASYQKPTSLSFGIVMVYHKYPLYEALEQSRGLLFDFAKKGQKNQTAIVLQKHSGQSAGLVFSNRLLPELMNFLQYIQKNRSKSEENDQVFLSAIHKCSLYASVLDNVKTEGECVWAIRNLFDSQLHVESNFITKLTSLLQTVRDGGFTTTDKHHRLSEIMSSVLRICKFFVEKGGDAE